MTDTAFGSAVGIWADLRAAQTYGDLDNLRIDAAPLLGDVNGDGLVNLADFNVIKMNLFNTGQARNQGDLTGDALVDFADFRQWKAAAGSGFASVTLFGVCRVRRRVSVGASPTRLLSFRPVALGAVHGGNEMD